jgi:hypothetical protein
MNKAVNRTTTQISNNKYKVYTKQSPINYKKSDGSYEEIDLTFQDTTSTIGNISLMDKGIISVGKRKGNNPHKVVGIRPDKNQHLGTQQLEFSLVNVELNGENQDFNVETDLEVKLKASKVFQLVKLNKEFNDCKIEFDIYCKGLELQNIKYDSNKTIRDYGFNLNNVGEDNGNSMLNTHNNYTNLNKDIPYLDFTVGKINNEFITMGQYTESEEFGSSDLSNYSIHEDMYTHGSAVYYKDTIVFTINAYNISNFEEIILNNLCNMYSLEVFDDGGYGKYLTKDNKKVIGYYIKDNSFVGFINTEEITNQIKNLFQRKTFQDTSYLNITLETFCNDIVEIFNKDLTIEVDNNYYKGGSFQFKINNESFFINKPIAFDKDYNVLDYDTYHTLKDNGDGSYRYTKILNINSALLHNTAKYIDVNLSTIQSDAYLPVYNSSSVKSTTVLTAARNATSSTGFTIQTGIVDFSSTHLLSIGSRFNQTYSSGQFGSSVSRQSRYYQTHHAFDTSVITDTVSSAKYKISASCVDDKSSTSAINLIALKSTYDGTDYDQATASGQALEMATWNDFDGFTSDWDSDDITEYSSSTSISDTASTLTYVSQEFVMNADAKTDIENNNTFSITAIDHDEFYQNSNDSSWGTFPSATANYDYRRILSVGQPDNTLEADRPYLEVTTTIVSTPVENATFFGTNF